MYSLTLMGYLRFSFCAPHSNRDSPLTSVLSLSVFHIPLPISLVRSLCLWDLSHLAAHSRSPFVDLSLPRSLISLSVSYHSRQIQAGLRA